MANLTITVDDLLLKRARMKALDEGTSVNALLREYLMSYTGTERTQRALAAFVDLAEQSVAGSAGDSRTWSRDALHDRSSRS